MLTLVNCREKELAKTQTDERPAGRAVCVCVKERERECVCELRLDAPVLLQLRSVC